MKIFFLILLAGFIVATVLYGERALRLFNSAILIAHARPYERYIKEAEVILVVGDSTAYGTGAKRPEESIAGRIGTQFPTYTVVNKGKNGQKVAQLLMSLKEGDIRMDNQLLLIQIGGNDILGYTDIETLRADVRELFSLAKSYAPEVVVMTSGNVGGASAFAPYGNEESQRYEERTRAVRTLFIEEATNSGVTYVDLFVEPEDDVFIQDSERYLAPDGLHPSSDGYAVWYQTLRPYLEKVLVK